MKPFAAAAAAAVISGTVMFVAGTRTTTVDAFTNEPSVTAPIELHGQAPVSEPPSRAVRAPVRTVSQAAARTSPARVERSQPVRRADVENEKERSWSKTALIIGGSAASGAGVGGVVNGKKGALIGAAIGGGAASIYEATQRR